MLRQKPVIDAAQKLRALTKEFERDFSVLEKTWRDIRKELQKAVDEKKLEEIRKSLKS